MRLLHTSDWHVGRLTYGVPRARDHDEVLAEILRLAREARPHLILHTGDLFDAARPAVEDMQRATSVLKELAAIAPVAVLAGNHDSPALFRLFGSLLGGPRDGHQPRIRFVDRARRGQDGILHYPVDTTSGEQILRIAPLPFVRDGHLVDTMEDPATWMRAYTDRIRLIEAALGVELGTGFDPARDVAVFAAHLYVGGATFHHSEKPLHVTEVYATTLEAIPPVSYAAFGHIHKPQALPGGAVTGRYAGSPIPLDFAERDETKTVVVVDVDPGRPAHIDVIPLTAGRPLRQFTGNLDDLGRLADGWGHALSKLIIHTEQPTSDLSERIAAMLPDAVLVDVAEICAGTRLRPVDETERDDADREPALPELFRDFLAQTSTRGVAADRVAARFAALLAALDAEEPPPADEQKLFDALSSHAERAQAIADGDIPVEPTAGSRDAAARRKTASAQAAAATTRQDGA